jgi:putative ABC transport system ATP-binding protein
MIKLTNLTKTFIAGDVQTAALNRINLGISKGEYVAVTGPSGCGKSTLLNILGMIDGTDSGEYWFEGQNVVGWSEKRLSELRRGRVGFIFQNFNLIEEMSVAENVRLALRYTGLAEEEQNGRVRAILDRLGIAHRANHHPSQLSGGQQQRVAIARALIAQPAILLADEPTGNLDTKNGSEVMDLLRVINSEGTTIIMVTHSLEHAEEASRVVHLLDGAVLSDTLKRPAPETTRADPA